MTYSYLYDIIETVKERETVGEKKEKPLKILNYVSIAAKIIASFSAAIFYIIKIIKELF